MNRARSLLHSPLRPILRPLVRSPFTRGGGGGFSPSQISFTSGLWLDQSDISTAFQDSAGTTPVTASGQQVGKRLDKSGQAHHFLQATSSARPEYDLISVIASDYTDGLDDGYSTAPFPAGTLASAMDLFVTIKRASTAQMVVILETTAATKYIGDMWNDVGPANANAGSAWTCFVDGVQIGGTATTTRAQLNTALSSGAYHVMEFHDLDLSTWTQFTLSLCTSFMLNADTAQLILCPSQTATIRSKLRTYCGAKGDLSL